MLLVRNAVRPAELLAMGSCSKGPLHLLPGPLGDASALCVRNSVKTL